MCLPKHPQTYTLSLSIQSRALNNIPTNFHEGKKQSWLFSIIGENSLIKMKIDHIEFSKSFVLK